MKYFAYGANTDPVGMRRRCPGARVLGPAILNDHRLVFRKQRAWRTGVAHVEPAPGSVVWGLLWEIEPDHERALDVFEEIDRGLYSKGNLVVMHDGARVEAMVYLANTTAPKRPSVRYLRSLVRGARAHGAPDEHIAALRRSRSRR